jgi:thymidine kinase
MPAQPPRVGRLEVICGCMFAGKTTELIRRAVAARDAGWRVTVIKPSSDTRSGETAVRTHAGEELPAQSAESASHAENLARDCEVAAIDEAHFFGAPLADVCRRLLGRGVRVIAAGLERDHRGEPFEPFPALLIEADEVLKLFAPCARCGAPAIHSQRMFASSARIAVGGAGQYEPRCRACFKSGA